MQDTIDIQKQVREIFDAYLENNKQRKTPERYSVLQEVYSRDDHFDADELHVAMQAQGHNISRATIYNTLELLVSCDLVSRHQFGETTARYEKSFGYKQHDHLICVDCKKVVEFCDPRIQQIKSMMGEILSFKVTHHSLNLYGQCDGHCDKSQNGT